MSPAHINPKDPLGRQHMTPLEIAAGTVRRDLNGNPNPEAAVYLKAVEHLPDNRVVVVDRGKYEATKNGTVNAPVKGLKEPSVGGDGKPGSGKPD
jgi:hypothetical protein